MVITISGDLATALCWQPKGRVQAQIDRAAGLLRLAAGDGFALYGKAGSPMVFCRLRLGNGPVEHQPAREVDHRIEDGALILTLPDWARPPQGRALPLVEATHPPAHAPDPPPAPVSAAGPTDKATPARLALVKELWPNPEIGVAEIMRRVNELPGEPYTTSPAMYGLAKRVGLPTIRQPAPAAAPQAPVPAPAARAPENREPTPAEEDEREAEQMVIAGQGARAIAEEFGWTLADTQAFVARVREKIAAQRQARAA
jgi:hypothetical protein